MSIEHHSMILIMPRSSQSFLDPSTSSDFAQRRFTVFEDRRKEKLAACCRERRSIEIEQEKKRTEFQSSIEALRESQHQSLRHVIRIEQRRQTEENRAVLQQQQQVERDELAEKRVIESRLQRTVKQKQQDRGLILKREAELQRSVEIKENRLERDRQLSQKTKKIEETRVKLIADKDTQRRKHQAIFEQRRTEFEKAKSAASELQQQRQIGRDQLRVVQQITKERDRELEHESSARVASAKRQIAISRSSAQLSLKELAFQESERQSAETSEALRQARIQQKDQQHQKIQLHELKLQRARAQASEHDKLKVAQATQRTERVTERQQKLLDSKTSRLRQQRELSSKNFKEKRSQLEVAELHQNDAVALLISQLAQQEQQADAVLQSHRQIQVQQNEQRHVAAMLKQDRIQEHQRTLAFKAEQVAQHANSVQENINNVTTLKKQYLQERRQLQLLGQQKCLALRNEIERLRQQRRANPDSEELLALQAKAEDSMNVIIGRMYQLIDTPGQRKLTRFLSNNVSAVTIKPTVSEPFELDGTYALKFEDDAYDADIAAQLPQSSSHTTTLHQNIDSSIVQNYDEEEFETEAKLVRKHEHDIVENTKMNPASLISQRPMCLATPNASTRIQSDSPRITSRFESYESSKDRAWKVHERSMLELIEREQQAEHERDFLLQHCMDTGEMQRLEAIFSVERARATARITAAEYRFENETAESSSG